MIILHRLSTHELPVPSRILSLSETIVLGFQTFQKTLDGVRETLVRSHLRHPSCVATACGHTEQCQEGQAGRLALVRHVRMVPDCAQLGGVGLGAVEIVAA